jgi:hypothetical protein
VVVAFVSFTDCDAGFFKRKVETGGRAMAQASLRGVPGSLPRQSMWDLW